MEQEIYKEIMALDDAKYHLKKYIEEHGAGNGLLQSFEHIEQLMIRYDLNYNDFLKVLVESLRLESSQFLSRAIKREHKLKTALAYNIKRKRLGRKNKVQEFADYIHRVSEPDFYTKNELEMFGYASPKEATKEMVAKKLEEAKVTLSRTSFHRLLKLIKSPDG